MPNRNDVRTGTAHTARADVALDRVRAFCLSLPGTTETGSWGHPNFRTAKRTFATFEWVRGRPSIAFRLDAVDVDLLVRRPGFFATPYGRGEWVSFWVDGRVNWRLVERLVRSGYRRADATGRRSRKVGASVVED